MTQQISTFLTAVAEFRRRAQSCRDYAAKPETDKQDTILYNGHAKAYDEAADYLEKELNLPQTLLEAFIDMRNIQKEYFKTRNPQVLANARRYERMVDTLIAERNKPKVPQTGNLFANE